MRYEILENNQVINVIEADEAFMSSQYSVEQYRLAEIQDSAPEMPLPPVIRRITRLAFLNRFTDGEAIALDLASIGATVEAAAIRRYLSKVNAAEFIDLDNAETRSGVQTLEAMGLLAEGRALIILDTEIMDTEKAR